MTYISFLVITESGEVLYSGFVFDPETRFEAKNIFASVVKRSDVRCWFVAMLVLSDGRVYFLHDQELQYVTHSIMEAVHPL